jgi:hypothetical protein
VNKKKPCEQINNGVMQNNIQPHNKNIEEIYNYFMDGKDDDETDNDEYYDDLNDDLNNNINDESNDGNKKFVCKYCDKIFTRNNNLQRHIIHRCKIKKKLDEAKELEKLKEELNLVVKTCKNMEANFENLKKEHEELKNNIGVKTSKKTTKITNNTINDNKQTNNGIINHNSNNNTVNIKVVQFGNEDIDKINLKDAIKLYLKSTGGNIVSNMLKFINFNEKYPENNNICITDMSRDIVKVHDGEQFVYKKFKNVKHDILDKVVNHIKKLVSLYENDDSYKKTPDIETKLKINNNSLKLICGEDIEETDSDEEDIDKGDNAGENKINDNQQNKCDIETVEAEIIKIIANNERERKATAKKQYRANIEHLNSKKEGLQKIAFEKMREELRNGKKLLETHKVLPLK